MNASFYRSSKGRLLFGLRARLHRTDFWSELSPSWVSQPLPSFCTAVVSAKVLWANFLQS